jgi:hypothetical protein
VEGIDYRPDLDLVTQAVKNLGYTHICPEALEELQEFTRLNGWERVVEGTQGHAMRQAYNRVMDGFRAMFAPL